MSDNTCPTCGGEATPEGRRHRHAWNKRTPGAWHDPKDYGSDRLANACAGHMGVQEQRGYCKTESCPDPCHDTPSEGERCDQCGMPTIHPPTCPECLMANEMGERPDTPDTPAEPLPCAGLCCDEPGTPGRTNPEGSEAICDCACHTWDTPSEGMQPPSFYPASKPDTPDTPAEPLNHPNFPCHVEPILPPEDGRMSEKPYRLGGKVSSLDDLTCLRDEMREVLRGRRASAGFEPEAFDAIEWAVAEVERLRGANEYLAAGWSLDKYGTTSYAPGLIREAVSNSE